MPSHLVPLVVAVEGMIPRERALESRCVGSQAKQTINVYSHLPSCRLHPTFLPGPVDAVSHTYTPPPAWMRMQRRSSFDLGGCVKPAWQQQRPARGEPFVSSITMPEFLPLAP